MLLAAILLLAPIPQNGEAAKMTREILAVIASNAASDSAKDSSLSQPVLAMPDAKVKTDAEIASESAAEPNWGLAAAGAVQPAYTPVSPAAVKTAGTRDYEASTNQRRLWYALTITGSGAAVLDAWSTRRAISEGYGTEANPMLRPFSHSGAMYVATQVSPAVMDFIGKRMMVSSHPLLRKMWWLPQAAGSGASIFAGVHNIGLVP